MNHDTNGYRKGCRCSLCREAHRVAERARRHRKNPPTEPLERFWAKVDMDAPTEHGCWLWTGSRDTSGYGLFRVDGRLFKAHRWSYERFIGPIPPGLQLDHLCRIQACVSPGHLEVVTSRENSVRRSMWNVYERRSA